MPSLAAAVVLIAHGVIHLIGFVVPWQLASLEGFAYRTTLLGGTLDVGSAGARAVGVIWLLIAVGFVVAGIAVRRGDSWALNLTVALAFGSLVVCVLGLPDAAAGIAVNVAILGVAAYVVVSRRRPGRLAAR